MHKPSQEKGWVATENIYDKVKGVMGVFGEKIVMSTDEILEVADTGSWISMWEQPLCVLPDDLNPTLMPATYTELQLDIILPDLGMQPVSPMQPEPPEPTDPEPQPHPTMPNNSQGGEGVEGDYGIKLKYSKPTKKKTRLKKKLLKAAIVPEAKVVRSLTRWLSME